MNPGSSPAQFHAGNAASDGADRRGWLVGHFLPEGELRKSHDVEVKWGVHRGARSVPSDSRPSTALPSSCSCKAAFGWTSTLGLSSWSAQVTTSCGDPASGTPGVPKKTPSSSRFAGPRGRSGAPGSLPPTIAQRVLGDKPARASTLHAPRTMAYFVAPGGRHAPPSAAEPAAKALVPRAVRSFSTPSRRYPQSRLGTRSQARPLLRPTPSSTQPGCPLPLSVACRPQVPTRYPDQAAQYRGGA